MTGKEEIISDNNTYIVKERFLSKRNEVYLVDLKKVVEETSPCVLKKYISDKNNKSKEAFLLKTLLQNGINVPKIYFEGSDYLLLEYIKGETLLEKLIKLENEQGVNIDYKKNHKILYDFFRWLQIFYNVTEKVLGKGYIFGDINFRNFIVGDRIYGIDLENCSCRGDKEIDGGKFCAYLLTYRPIFTEWKIELTILAIEVMTKEFNYNYSMLKENFEKELKEIEKRRNIKVKFHNIRQIFHI